MFRDGTIADVIVRRLAQYRDSRGWLIELFRSDELLAGQFPAMGYVSQTEPGVVRGPHSHREQTDCFAFLGPGELRLFLWDNRPHSPTHRARQILNVGQSAPTMVIIPPGVVHAYRNESAIPAWAMNFPNRLYAGENRCEPVDEIRYENVTGHPFQIDSSDEA